ncbi:amidase family protein [Marinibaculum pumilum]|uniref:Amidase family protein n=1 Tax=Marinibaculum pumilum TaxID=1766165 RepID=A0ABV7L7T7_9PROT
MAQATGPLWKWDAVDLAAAIATRRLSSREAVQASLDRMQAVNPKINAVVESRADEALAAADAADRAVAAGDALGPLHGVPVTIKVNVDQKGYATSNGISAFADLQAPSDSPVVVNWKKAGAVIVGRTNTPAFSMRWFTDNALYGQTLNPLNAKLTPGGSSGGAAAAVAAGICPLAHGNDYGGSVRYPAYACGLAGLRPSFGRVPAYIETAPRERPMTAQLMSVQGPLARRVRDVRTGLAAMTARDPRDPWWVPAPLQGPAPARPIRVAVCADPFGDGVHPDVKSAIGQAAGWLADAGYAVEEVAVPRAVEAAEHWLTLVMSDTRRGMAGAIAELGDDAIKRAYEGMDAGAPAEIGFTDYMAALEGRTTVLRTWSLFQEDYPLVLMPVSMQPPFEQVADQQGANAFAGLLQAQRPLTMINLMGLPGMSVATGISADGTAMGVQIVGQRFREDLCLDAAEVVEARAGVSLPIDPR